MYACTCIYMKVQVYSTLHTFVAKVHVVAEKEKGKNGI